MSRTTFPAWLTSAKALLFVVVASLCLPTSAVAQSGNRVLPSASPVQAQPTFTQFPQGQVVAPAQGSATRAVPVQQGSATRAMPVEQGSATRAMPAQQGSATRAMPSNAGSATRGMNNAPRVDSFESKFWNYLVRSKYRNWAPVPGQSDAAYEGESPHGAYLKMFLNRKAAGNTSSLPNGSILIKENYSPEQALAAITVMYKTAGYNAAAGDWYWVKYNPDGTVASKSTDSGNMRLAGRVKGCIECHGDADGDDFVFFND